MKVIFFDIDDTLLGTSNFAKVAREAAINMMVENGLPLSHSEAYNLLQEIIVEKGSNYNKHFNLLTERVYGKENPMLIALGMVSYHNVKFALLKPFAKTLDILIYLKSKGYRLAVISNGRTIKQWEKLVRLNLHNFFDEVITSEEVSIEKPNKGIFEESLKRMNTKAENSIMVGNKFDVDVLGGLNAGMDGILVNSNLSEDKLNEIRKNYPEVIIIDNISQLNEYL
ncbi:TIGR02253 family HAD-type hydrolase [Methanobrevibacter curvatus]|uniref:Glyceraldehyde 3-phosphate phosphatase n=1 Tax=Methanobrevibacter curvatus TaxID=49547 RepID=A0A166B0E3_9EURY|nr:TIGR02253 family HAD-type hydrolase [Methanobrevibacter curvatus]KZX12704.1 pyrimidine 5'-nucleotidase YjjG [Methanobrevibacter curvatus]